jgi:hypothetical protein
VTGLRETVDFPVYWEIPETSQNFSYDQYPFSLRVTGLRRAVAATAAQAGYDLRVMHCSVYLQLFNPERGTRNTKHFNFNPPLLQKRRIKRKASKINISLNNLGIKELRDLGI